MEIPLWQEDARREAEWDDYCSCLPHCSCCARPIHNLPCLHYEDIFLCEECLGDHTVTFFED